MTVNLFTYGTLQCPELLRAVCGLDRHGSSARLDGYRREGVRGTAYPAIIKDPAGSVPGTLYGGLPRGTLVALDRFEGDEYRRVVVRVSMAEGGDRLAWCYLLDPRLIRRLDSRPWDLQAFQRLHLAAYLRRLRRGGW